jgi:hypothetical protein
MNSDVPRHYGAQIEEGAHAQRITTDEAIERIFQAGLEMFVRDTPSPSSAESAPTRSYESFFGVAKGRPGAYGSPEAADRYIEDLRNAS